MSSQRVLLLVIDDRLTFPILQPKIAGDQGIVLIGFTITFLPIVELTSSKPEPVGQMFHCNADALGPMFDEVDNSIADIMGNPGRFQSPPRSFFS